MIGTNADASPNANEEIALDKTDAINLLLDRENTPSQASEVTQESQTEDTEVVSVDEVEATEETDVVEDQSEVTEAETEDYRNSEESSDEATDDVYIAKVDGEEVEVTAKELLDSYQLNSVAKKKYHEAMEERNQAKNELINLEAERKHYAENLELLRVQLQQTANNGITEEQWNELYQKDPMAYMKAKEDIRDQEQRLRAIQQEQRAVAQKQLESEQVKLLERIPEWKDPDVAAKERNNIVTYAKRFGFTEQEIGATNDSRVVDLLRRAYLYDALQSKKPEATKQVKKAPKMIKSGQPKGKVNVSEQNRKSAFDKLAKSGRKEDAVAYLLTK